MSHTAGRRRFSYEQKRLILKEHLNEGATVTSLARKYQVHPITIYNWKRMMDPNSDPPQPNNSYDELLKELEELKKENQQLKKCVGELKLDNDAQKQLLDKFKKKQRKEKLNNLSKKS